MKSLVVAILIFGAINLAACGGPSADLQYLDSRVMPDLEVPPDLTLEVVDSDFELPSVFSGDGAGTANGIPVLASVDSIKLEGRSDFYWLSIDEPVDNLYQLIKDFWASEGFTLAMDEPVIGVMKTNWVFNEEGRGNEGKGFFARLFSGDDLSASQDQFKTRIAREAGGAASQIYLSHRGTEYKHVLSTRQTEDNERNDWGFRASEPELEVEMLSRLMLYLGLRQAEVDQQMSNIKLFTPRASIHTVYSENDVEVKDKSEAKIEAVDETYILVKDEFTRTWYRTLHQLDRLNFDVISADISSGLGGKGVMLVETDIEIEVDVSGFFSFTPKIKTVKKRVNLIFSEETHEITRIDMETDEGETESSPAGIEFLALLYQHIK